MNKGKKLIAIIAIIMMAKAANQQNTNLGVFEEGNKNARVKLDVTFSNVNLIKNWTNSSLEISNSFDFGYKGFLTPTMPNNQRKSRELMSCDENKDKCIGYQIYENSLESGSAFTVTKYSYLQNGGYKELSTVNLVDPEGKITFAQQTEIFDVYLKSDSLYIIFSALMGNSGYFDIYLAKINNDFKYTLQKFNIQFTNFDSSKYKILGRYTDIDQGYILAYKVEQNQSQRTNRTEGAVVNSIIFITRLSDGKVQEFDLTEFSNFENKLFIESCALYETNTGDLIITFTEFYQKNSGISEVKITNFDEKKLESKIKSKLENSLQFVRRRNTDTNSYTTFTFNIKEEDNSSTFTIGTSDKTTSGNINYSNQFNIGESYVQISNEKSSSILFSYYMTTKVYINPPIYLNPGFQCFAFNFENKYIIVNERGENKFIDAKISPAYLNLDTNLRENEDPLKNFELYSGDGSSISKFTYSVYNHRNFMNKISKKKVKIQIVKGGVISPISIFNKQMNSNYFLIDQPYATSDTKTEKIPKVEYSLPILGLKNIIGEKNKMFLKKFLIGEDRMIGIENNSVKFYSKGKLDFTSNFKYTINSIIDFKMTKTYMVILYKTEGDRLCVVELDLFAQNLTNNIYFETSTRYAKLRLNRKKADNIEVDVESVQIFVFNPSKNTIDVYNREVFTQGNYELKATIQDVKQNQMDLILPSLSEFNILAYVFIEENDEYGKVMLILKHSLQKKVLVYSVDIHYSDNFKLMNPSASVLKAFDTKNDFDNFTIMRYKFTLFFGLKTDSKFETFDLKNFVTRKTIDLKDFGYNLGTCDESFMKDLVFCYNSGLEFMVINDANTLPENRVSFFKFSNPYLNGSPPTSTKISFSRVNDNVYFIADFGSVSESSDYDSSYYSIASLTDQKLGVAYDQMETGDVKFMMKPAVPVELEVNRYDNSLKLNLDYSKDIKKMAKESKNVLSVNDISDLKGSITSVTYGGDEFKVTGGNQINRRPKTVSLPDELKYRSMLSISSPDYSREANYISGYITVLDSGDIYLGTITGINRVETLSRLKNVKDDNCDLYTDKVFTRMRLRKDGLDFIVICGDVMNIGSVDLYGKISLNRVFATNKFNLAYIDEVNIEIHYNPDKLSFLSLYDYNKGGFRIFKLDISKQHIDEYDLSLLKIDTDGNFFHNLTFF